MAGFLRVCVAHSSWLSNCSDSPSCRSWATAVTKMAAVPFDLPLFERHRRRLRWSTLYRRRRCQQRRCPLGLRKYPKFYVCPCQPDMPSHAPTGALPITDQRDQSIQHQPCTISNRSLPTSSPRRCSNYLRRRHLPLRIMDPIAAANSFESVNSNLLSLLGRPRISDCSEATYVLSSSSPSRTDDDEITTASPSPFAFRPSRPSHSAPLGPVPIPGLEAAVNFWLTSHDIPPSEIPSGSALCAAVGQPTPRFLRRRLRVFRTAATYLGLDPDDLPTEDDLRLKRAWPRILHALARVAAILDPDGWASAAERAALQLPDAGGWRACTVDEQWDGDWLVRGMAAAHAGEKCTVVVAGTQGGGKTATVCRLLGRVGPAHNHALSCVRSHGEMREEDREEERKLKHVKAVSFPIVPIEVNVPYGSAEVDRTHVKVDGRMMSFVELPSMEKCHEYQDQVGAEIIAQFGKFDDVVAEVQREPAYYVVMMERLDDLDKKRFEKLVARLQRIYGKHVLNKTIVVLTHGQELPPADLSYEVWVFDRIRVVKEVLQKLNGERRPVQVPVVVFENSDSCKRDEASGRAVLPDGTKFLEQFLQEFREVVKRNAALPPLNPIPTKRWWEDYVILFGVAFLVMRLF